MCIAAKISLKKIVLLHIALTIFFFFSNNLNVREQNNFFTDISARVYFYLRDNPFTWRLRLVPSNRTDVVARRDDLHNGSDSISNSISREIEQHRVAKIPLWGVLMRQLTPGTSVYLACRETNVKLSSTARLFAVCS